MLTPLQALIVIFFICCKKTKFCVRACVRACVRVCKTTSRSDGALSAIFCIIVYCCLLDTETLVMLRIVCIHGNANYSQSEILHFQFFLWGSMPSDPLRDQKFISSLHACKISGPCRSPFFYTCRVDSSANEPCAPVNH